MRLGWRQCWLSACSEWFWQTVEEPPCWILYIWRRERDGSSNCDFWAPVRVFQVHSESWIQTKITSSHKRIFLALLLGFEKETLALMGMYLYLLSTNWTMSKYLLYQRCHLLYMYLEGLQLGWSLIHSLLIALNRDLLWISRSISVSHLPCENLSLCALIL